MKHKRKQSGIDWLDSVETFEGKDIKFIDGEHPAMLDDESFLKEVLFDFGRTGGPGGQHRNRKATACTATHIPSTLSGTASERRRQSENRKLSISRLRRTLAIRLRRNIDTKNFQPSTLWEERRDGEALPINPKHRDYPHILTEVLDALQATGFDHKEAATLLLISPSQIIKLVGHDKDALSFVNEQRKESSLHPLKV